MNIRRARIDDWQGIARLLDQLGYPGAETFIQARLTAMLADPAEVLLVYEDPVSPAPAPAPAPASSILGFLSLHFIPQIARGEFARISYFAVDEDTRSIGIGRQLEETATRLARERGCDLMEVHCHSRRTRAHEFYRRQGWEESPKYLIKRLL